MEPILTLDHLSYAYHTLEGETKALSDISLSVKPGEFTAIVGPSGYSAQWKIIKRKRDQHWLYAAARSSF